MGKRKFSFPEEVMASFSLFASLSTLICCALPALLVALGMGAVVAGLAADVPGLIWLSSNKLYVFVAAGFLLLAAGLMRGRGAARTCPIDPLKARACGRLKAASFWIYWSAVVLYSTGVVVTYIVPRLM